MAFPQVAALFIAILCLLGESDSQSLSYAITVRDFLPHFCSLTRTVVGPGEKFTQVPATNLDPRCPYLDDIKSGKISGHPDFNSEKGSDTIPGGFYNEHKVSGSNGYLLPFSRGRFASPGSTDFESTVREYTETASSGLPKPMYCASNSFAGFDGEVRCGYYEKTSPVGVTQLFSTVCSFEVLKTMENSRFTPSQTKRISTCGTTTISCTTEESELVSI